MAPAKSAMIDGGQSEIEAHSKLGIGARYHLHYQNTFQKAKLTMV